MAGIDKSAVVGDIRGSVGDVTFARNRAGAYAFAKNSPVFPNTSRQQQANGALTAVKSRWQNLSDSQRADWISAATSPEWARTSHMGNIYQPSGYQLFMQLNLSLAYFVIQLDEPPAKVSFPHLHLDSFSTIPASPTHDSDIRFSGDSFDTDFRLLLFTTSSMSLGRTKSKPSFFRWTNHYSYSDVSVSLNYKWSYQNIWGATPNPARVFVRLELVSLTSGERQLIGIMSNA